MDRNRGGRPHHPDVLTPAEWRVLEALRDGGTNAEIGARLGLSLDTVKYHISNMLAKLELRDRRALAAWRPEQPRGRLRGAVLVGPAAVWSVVGRPLVWVGLGTAAVAGVAVAVVAAAGVVVVVLAVVGGDGDTTRVVTPPLVATAQGPPGPVVSCESGIAVTNPDANPDLEADCESLLGLRDRLRGTGALNWTAGKPMSEWMGVTVSGTPQRVTALNLADLGLDGELSGLLGNLTGLTTLNLSGNVLTGMLPSKLALLTSLTDVSLSGTSFTGCAPPVLRTAATNDVAATGPDDCGAPTTVDLITIKGDTALAPGTYRVEWGDLPRIVFDVPAGVGNDLVFWGIVSGSPTSVAFRNPDQTAAIGLGVQFGGELWRRFASNFPAGTERDRMNEIFDRVVESMWRVSP